MTPTASLTPVDLEALRVIARKSLFTFAKGVLGFSWLNERIHLPLCKMLEDYETSRYLRICLPRGWLKTTLVSQAYPIWRAVRDPNIRILLVQNTHTNAVQKLQTIDSIFRGNELFRLLFPEILPTAREIWKADAMCVKRSAPWAEATFEAAGIKTKIVSRHYNLIIEDDTVAPDLDEMGAETLVPTKEDIGQAIGFHRQLGPILVDLMADQQIVVGTRWFEEDLLSWIEKHEPRYTSYVRSCRENSRGESDESGELTYPERFDGEVLDGLRHSMGPYLFSCLYYNKPVRSGDMIFNPEWFSYYETPPRDLLCYTTVDLAGDPEESKGDPDFNVVVTCGKSLTTGYVYVLDYFRRKCGPSEVIHAIFDHAQRYRPVVVGIEAIQYQKALVGWVRQSQRTRGIFFTVEPITHGRKSKNIRIQGLQPQFAAGNIKLRTSHKELMNELTVFPLGANDDVADALSMQLPMWAITSTKKDRNPELDDPMSMAHTLAAIKNERESSRALAYDIFEMEPVYDGFL